MEGLAYRELLGPASHADRHRFSGADHLFNARNVDDDAAIHLPEQLGIQLTGKLLDRAANVHVTAVRGDLGVLGFALEVRDLFCRNDADLVTYRGLDPPDVIQSLVYS